MKISLARSSGQRLRCIALGSGFLEKVYENALVLELRRRFLKAVQQADIPVVYRDQLVGTYYADVLVNDTVICEIKAAAAIDGAHQAQLLNYLKATGLGIGLVIELRAAARGHQTDGALGEGSSATICVRL